MLLRKQLRDSVVKVDQVVSSRKDKFCLAPCLDFVIQKDVMLPARHNDKQTDWDCGRRTTAGMEARTTRSLGRWTRVNQTVNRRSGPKKDR